MGLKNLVIYRTLTGRIPFHDWLVSLRDVEGKARIRTALRRLTLGNLGDHKAVASGVFELRLHFGPGYRVYFGQDGMVLVVILCGGDKSSQRHDIAKAQEYWIDYKRRSNETQR